LRSNTRDRPAISRRLPASRPPGPIGRAFSYGSRRYLQSPLQDRRTAPAAAPDEIPAETAALIKAEGLDVYRDDLGTSPRVYYKNLYRWTKAFVAGSVVFGDTGECAEGAKVVVSQNGTVLSDAVTNNFGDYCIDGLNAEGSYLILIEADGYKPVEDTVTIDGGSVTRPAQFLEWA
jgi:hypothetical protein